jgi:ribonuclease-3
MLDESKEPPKDAKTTLQEWAQSQGLPLPNYREDSMIGPAHEPVFVIEVMVEGNGPVKASGKTKQKAEQLAAELLLKELKGG